MNVCFVQKFQRSIDEQGRWMYCHFRKLVSFYRKSPCLWKKDARNYLNRERRHRAYARIHRAMDLPGVTVVGIVLKIREMRRLYVKELKKVLEAESTGRCYEISLPWFYDLHRFLYPYLDYDESVELHENRTQTFAESREMDEGEPCVVSSNCNCIRCSLSTGNYRSGNFLNSISSPTVSLRKVTAHPRACSSSCTRITDRRKQLDRFPSNTEKCHEFAICGLRNVPSSNNSCDSRSDQLEAFAAIVAQCLKKLDKSYVQEAQTEIQEILENMLLKSQRADGIDPPLVDRSVTISIQPVSQSAGQTRTKMARFAPAKRRMRSTQLTPDNGLSFDREAKLKRD